MGKGNFFKSVGKSIKKGSHSISNTFKSGGKKLEGAVSDVYHDVSGGVSNVYSDVKSAGSYVGKHVINDVDTLTDALSSPLLWIVVGGVVILIVVNR